MEKRHIVEYIWKTKIFRADILKSNQASKCRYCSNKEKISKKCRFR